MWLCMAGCDLIGFGDFFWVFLCPIGYVGMGCPASMSFCGEFLTGQLPQTEASAGRWRLLAKVNSDVFWHKKHNLLAAVRQHWEKVDIAARRKKAGWDNDYLPEFLSGF